MTTIEATVALVAAILLSLGGAGGLFMAVLRLRGGNPPMPLTLVHGAGAGLGVVVLVVATVMAPGTWLIVALVAAVLGAPLGLAMHRTHHRQRLIPLTLMIPHGLLEVGAVVCAWIAVGAV